MASDQIEVAALGRPFALGMLYDAHRDKLDTAFILWDKKTLQESSEKRSHYSSFHHSTVSDSIDSKSTLLDINASLKASFLSGLVEVGGSASYLNDNKKFKNQSRVTFSYKATTIYEQLAMTHLEAKNMKIREAIEKSSATHVVTGILYGANAFFVFDSEKLDSSCVQNIQGSMESVIKKIPSLEIEGKMGIKLSNEEKALTQKFSCKYYGDFILESNPATFEDAVKTYTQLPKQLGEHGERSVPVKVWLTPLKNLDPTAAELKREICVGLVRKAENVLEMMKEVEMRCNDSLEEKMVKGLQPIFKKLSHFQKHCRDYTTTLKHSMEEKFPAIRAGEKDVSSVEKLFDQKESSPFSHDNLKKWLDNEEREINIIRSCVDLMEGTKIVQKQANVDREVLAPGVEDVLCFVFTSMETTDAYLDQMASYLHSHEQKDASVTPPTKEQWYISAEVVSKMRQKAKEFNQLAKGLMNSRRFRFLIAAMPNKNYKGATIYHYMDGSLVTEDFSRPRLPPVESIKDRRVLIWCKSVCLHSFQSNPVSLYRDVLRTDLYKIICR
ncbi:Neoverrucotoxin subunit alpha [Channa argus]|uniref:Neoverrucotoxin subunit alpha n=1 Tax=Channa argus TaxID=215402 RepID=A0A6G1QMU3_CHAAH|nr:Neoverrucotoxin subunit alpha [Channa argus]